MFSTSYIVEYENLTNGLDKYATFLEDYVESYDAKARENYRLSCKTDDDGLMRGFDKVISEEEGRVAGARDVLAKLYKIFPHLKPAEQKESKE